MPGNLAAQSAFEKNGAASSRQVAAASVPVVWAVEPMGQYQTRWMAPGCSIEEMLAALPELPDGFDEDGIVAIGDVEVPRQAWGYKWRPRDDDRPVVMQVGIRLQGSGGGSSGGGKSVLKTAAVVALLVAAVAVGQFQVLGSLGAIGASSVTGSQLLAAGNACGALHVRHA